MMRRPGLILTFGILLLCFAESCEEEKHDINVPNYFAASPSSVTLHVGTDTTVALGGGALPYFLISEPKANVATVTLEETILRVHGAGTGTTRARVGDSSPSQQVVEIPIIVTPNPTTRM